MRYARLLALSATLAAAAPLAGTLAQAGQASPASAIDVDLGSTRGSAYYVAQSDGYHLVATLQSGRASTPVRLEAVLGDGQSTTVSIPGPAGTTPTAVVFTHGTDRLIVRTSTDDLDDQTATR